MKQAFILFCVMAAFIVVIALAGCNKSADKPPQSPSADFFKQLCADDEGTVSADGLTCTLPNGAVVKFYQ